jgi:MFS family permease
VPTGSSGKPHLSADTRRILIVQALRAFAYGLGSVLLGIVLAEEGLGTTQVGLVLAGLLGGAALTSFALGRYGDVIGRRRAYIALLLVMGASGTVLAVTDWVPALVLAALTGTISTEVVESGPFTSLEQAMLPGAAAGRNVPRLFGTYNSIAALAGSLGALGAILPALTDTSAEYWLLAYPVAAAAAVPFAARLSPAVDARPRDADGSRALSDESRGFVKRLAALFAVDSFAGGFVVQTFIAYWFVTKFGTSSETLGIVFFTIGLMQAASFAVAMRLASRFGLLATMVFTHLPSNVLLAAIPFAPSQASALALLVVRSTLAQMDVPTRQAYVVSLVGAPERTAAAAYTNGARHAVRPVGPLLIGPLTQLALGAPFVVAGIVKSGYDLVLYGLFRDVQTASVSPDVRTGLDSPH